MTTTKTLQRALGILFRSVTLAADVFRDATSNDEVDAQYIVHGTAKAWANLNGTGTIALRDSLNVASVVDNGTGDYIFSLTSIMAANTYSLVATAGTNGARRTAETLGAGSQSSSAFRVYTTDLTGTVGDSDLVSSGVFGDLA
jgi:hypothetical protein